MPKIKTTNRQILFTIALIQSLNLVFLPCLDCPSRCIPKSARPAELIFISQVPTHTPPSSRREFARLCVCVSNGFLARHARYTFTQFIEHTRTHTLTQLATSALRTSRRVHPVFTHAVAQYAGHVSARGLRSRWRWWWSHCEFGINPGRRSASLDHDCSAGKHGTTEQEQQQPRPRHDRVSPKESCNGSSNGSSNGSTPPLASDVTLCCVEWRCSVVHR